MCPVWWPHLKARPTLSFGIWTAATKRNGKRKEGGGRGTQIKKSARSLAKTATVRPSVLHITLSDLDPRRIMLIKVSPSSRRPSALLVARPKSGIIILRACRPIHVCFSFPPTWRGPERIIYFSDQLNRAAMTSAHVLVLRMAQLLICIRLLHTLTTLRIFIDKNCVENSRFTT